MVWILWLKKDWPPICCFMSITEWKIPITFSPVEKKEAALIILNHILVWPLSYIKPNGIIHFQSDAAHKLFNQIDRYITNWVGSCHPSSIFLWSCSLQKILYGWWVCGEMKHPDLQRGHLSIIWQLYSPVSSAQAAGNADVKSSAALSACQQRKSGVNQQIKKKLQQLIHAWCGCLFD